MSAVLVLERIHRKGALEVEVESVLHYETTSKLILMVASALSLYPSRVKSNLNNLLKTFYHILGQT